jgi:predicted aspartyl protease
MAPRRSPVKRAIEAARLVSAATSLFALALHSVVALGACKIGRISEIPIAVKGYPVIQVSLNGHAARMIVDTGASASMLWQSAIGHYGLNRVGGLSGEAQCGVGGCKDSQLVNVKDFGMAGYVVHDLRFAAAPAATERPETAGLLGQDFLSAYDLEFDLAANRLRLLQTQGSCGDQLAYWTDAYYMVKLNEDRSGTHWLLGPVSLNGHELTALFDTGAPDSTVMRRVTERPGLGPELPAHNVGQYAGVGRRIETSIGQFASLTVGQETVQHPALWIADVFAALREAPVGSLITKTWFEEPDVIIGIDFFRAHRVLIANSQRRIYFTYLGGPLFALPTGEKDSAQSATTSTE